METARTWTEDYYDAMLHYAWAPEDLDHLSDPDRERKRGRRNPNQTVTRLRRLEVPFNHILAFFFSLAPSSVVTQLFQEYVSLQEYGHLEFLGRRAQNEVVTQPDLVFESHRAFLTIEVKTSAKSDIEQLQKYAYLHAVAGQARPGRSHGLLFLTPYPKERLFPGKFEGWDVVRHQAAIALNSSEDKKSSVKKIASSNACDFLVPNGRLSIGHCSFDEFTQLIGGFCEIAPRESVEARLYRGLLTEIKRRMTHPA